MPKNMNTRREGIGSFPVIRCIKMHAKRITPISSSISFIA